MPITGRWKRRLICALAAGLCAGIAAAEDPTAAERERMVRLQIEARGVGDAATLAALRQVPRHRFVPEERRAQAYQDSPLPIGYGQTISQPYIVGYMTELVRPRPGMRVLEIGTGSGYQAAVLAAAGAEVYSIEIVQELARWGEKNLRETGFSRNEGPLPSSSIPAGAGPGIGPALGALRGVNVRAGDGYHGWPDAAPFDAIVVTAAADHIPPPLLNQLKDGGRMVIPVGSPFRTQTLMLVTRRGKDVSTESLLPVRFVPLTRAVK